MSLRFQKGQGATEYLVLLAVVLIVAMVAIALLGFFPGLSYDAKKSETDAYWRSVKPFQIIGHALPSGVDTNLTLVLMNSETEQMNIQNISVDGSGFTGTNFTASSSYLSAGETRNYVIGLAPHATCVSGTIYEMEVNFTYSNTATGLTDLKQAGVKKIIGKCS
jgi:hypothetical protein